MQEGCWLQHPGQSCISRPVSVRHVLVEQINNKAKKWPAVANLTALLGCARGNSQIQTFQWLSQLWIYQQLHQRATDCSIKVRVISASQTPSDRYCLSRSIMRPKRQLAILLKIEWNEISLQQINRIAKKKKKTFIIINHGLRRSIRHVSALSSPKHYFCKQDVPSNGWERSDWKWPQHRVRKNQHFKERAAPIPPCNKRIDLLYLFGVLQKVQNCVVESLGVSNRVRSRKDWRRR